MDCSPLVSPKIKEYITKHNLEEKLNEAINYVLKKQPDDPFSALTNTLKNNCSSVFNLNSVKLHKVISIDFKPYITIEVVMTLKGNTRKCFNSALTYNAKSFEFFMNNIDFTISTFNKNFSHLVTDTVIEQFSSFDKILKGVYEDLAKIDHNSGLIGKLLSNAISIAVYSSQSIIQEIEVKDLIKEELKAEITLHNNLTIPNLAFSIFKCGKTMNSKVKFERFLLIINNSHKLKKEELFSIVCKVYTSTKKMLTSGKQGELGLKLNNEGSYITPTDTLNDTVKILEEIIKDTGEKVLSIGIDCNANNYYNETTKKYDMDGFKQPPDAEALIEYYIKYCSEHPLISYLEDPIADSDRVGWNKVHHKFESVKHVIISTKSLIEESFSKLKQITQMSELEDPLEHMTMEEKMQISQSNKFKKEDNLKKIQLSNIGFRLNEFVNLSELFECYKYSQTKLSSEKIVGVTMWDNAVENDQASVVDIAIGLRANLIVLHGISNRSERVNKINRYFDLIEQLY